MAFRPKPLAKLLLLTVVGTAAYAIASRNEPLALPETEVKTSQGALQIDSAKKSPHHFRIALSERPGLMPFVIANGGLRTAPGSAAAEQGLDLEFSFIEDAIGKNQALREHKVDFTWQTVDELPIHVSAFKQAGIELRTVLELAASRGSDACVASEDVRSAQDLLGRHSAMMMFSPDHTLFEFMLRNSQLTPEQVKVVRTNTSFSMNDHAYARALFAQGKVDVACLWEPDVSIALKSRPGAHVLFSTADASGLIAEVLVTSKALLDAEPELVAKLTAVWFAGVERASANKVTAARAIATQVPRFRDELGAEGTLRAFDWVKWANETDNARFFGIGGERALFDRIYDEASELWVAYPEASVGERRLSSSLRDDRAVRPYYPSSDKMLADDPHYEPALAERGDALFTKPITINYDPDKTELDAESLYIVNTQILPQLELTRAMHIRVEGNSDTSGDSATNRKLSELRARATADYLISRGIDPKRISFKGNGDSAPIASNKTKNGRATNRRTDILFIQSLERR